jgi:hypothetical protein
MEHLNEEEESVLTQEAGTQTQTPRPHIEERKTAQEHVPQSAGGEECAAEMQEMFKHIEGGEKSLAEMQTKEECVAQVQERGKHSTSGQECVE